MTQKDAVTKSYESLLFLIPKLNGKHRKILESHLEQVYVAGYEYGVQSAPKSKPVLHMKEEKIINRYRGIDEAAKVTGVSEGTIRYSIRNKSKCRGGDYWEHDKNIR